MTVLKMYGFGCPSDLARHADVIHIIRAIRNTSLLQGCNTLKNREVITISLVPVQDYPRPHSSARLHGTYQYTLNIQAYGSLMAYIYTLGYPICICIYPCRHSTLLPCKAKHGSIQLYVPSRNPAREINRVHRPLLISRSSLTSPPQYQGPFVISSVNGQLRGLDSGAGGLCCNSELVLASLFSFLLVKDIRVHHIS